MLFYIHGFNTGAKGFKANKLALYFQDVPFYRVNQAYNPHLAISHLETEIQRLQHEHQLDDSQVTLVGSSLGGFYTRYLMSKREYNGVLINPSIDPLTTLKPALGAWKNYVTGEKYRLREEDLATLADYYTDNASIKGRVLLLVEEGDEVLDASESIAAYTDMPKAILKIYPGGSHQFDNFDDALPIIKGFYQENRNRH